MKKIIYLFMLILSAGCQKQVEAPSMSYDLEGIYKTSCKSVGSNTYTMTTITATGGNFEMSGGVFSDSACTTSTLAISSKGGYTTSFQKEDSYSYVGNFDFIVGEYSITPQSQSYVNSYNSNSYCGKTDWALGVAKIINGLTCEGDLIPNAGTPIYSIYSIGKIMMEGVQDQGALYLGVETTEKPGTSEDTRMNAVSSTPYFKQ